MQRRRDPRAIGLLHPGKRGSQWRSSMRTMPFPSSRGAKRRSDPKALYISSSRSRHCGLKALINQHGHSVSFCESLMHTHAMFRNSPLQIIGYTDVQGAIILAGHHVYVIITICFQGFPSLSVLDCSLAFARHREEQRDEAIQGHLDCFACRSQ